MAIYTAGFAEWTAERFFQRLKLEAVDRLIDVRLRPSSQLAGFAKQRDLQYFLRSIVNAEYLHEPRFAPTAEILDAYRKRKLTWEVYEKAFTALLADRKVEETVDRAMFAGSPVLLCSEHAPDMCHRRLVCDYLSRYWSEVAEVVHLT
jgi:uncharacterized protein (DUF488 family)